MKPIESRSNVADDMTCVFAVRCVWDIVGGSDMGWQLGRACQTFLE